MMTVLNRLLTRCRHPERESGLFRMFSGRDTIAMVVVIVAGAGVYGATIGLWRSPLQALYTSIKFPLLLLATTIANALINGMLAQLLGSRMTFRESTLSLLGAYAMFACILASLSPVTLFILYNTPPLGSTTTLLAHNFMLLSHVGLIALAGWMAHVRLFRCLVNACESRAVAGRVLTAWLTGNLFLGAQLSWILRPFVGSPGLPVECLRADAFSGTFYESVGQALWRIVCQQQ